MKQIFLQKNNNKRLLLFFAGWGADDNLFGRNVKEEYDYMICFDYENLDFDFSTLACYNEITVLAWSMGVWVANEVLARNSYIKPKIKSAIAFNGTIHPIDDKLGIPREIFKSTLDNFSESTLVKFRRRICGNTQNVKEFLSHTPQRSIESLKSELTTLFYMITSAEVKETLRWSNAIIGMYDKIFPPVNQFSAWKEVKDCHIEQTEAEHYCLRIFDYILMNPDAYNTQKP